MNTDTLLEAVQIPFRDTLTFDLLMALGIGVISGVIAALIFFLIMRVLKPRIIISNKIVKECVKKDDGTEEFVYRFKFINKTRSNIENVSIDLFLMEEYFNGTGKNYSSKGLTLAKPEFKFLAGTNEKNGENHNNCVQMRITEDLEKVWNGEKEWLHVQIDSTHAKSGRRKVYVKRYTDSKNTICEGKFDSGENFDIIK